MSQLRKEGLKLPLGEVYKRLRGLTQIADFAETLTKESGPNVYDFDGFQGLTVPELRTLGTAILLRGDVFEGYRLMAQTPQDGQGTYYDRIIGPQHQRGHQVVKSILKDSFHSRVDHALDIAAGTGESSIRFSGIAKCITAIDVSADLLREARRKLQVEKDEKSISSYGAALMDATELGFADNSFDVVTDHALIAYLSPSEMVKYWRGIHRVLKPGGKYYSYYAEDPQPHITYVMSPRAELAGAVAASLFSFSLINQHRNDPPNLYPESAGFEGGAIEISGGHSAEVVLEWKKPLSSNP